MGRINEQQMCPLYRLRWFQDTIQVNSRSFVSSDKSESIFFPVITRRDFATYPEMGSGKGTRSRNSQFLFLAISCPEKERKVTSSNRSFPAKSIHKETTIQDGDSQVSMTIDIGQRLDCLHRHERCLSTCSNSPLIQEIYLVHVWRSGLPIHSLTFRMFLSLRSNSQLTISHTKYCLKTVQSLDFIPNLKKSDLIPAQKFTFIGMEFLTQENIVRVPVDQVNSLILTIKVFLSQTPVSALTSLSLLGKLSAAADFVLLGRLHLRPLQMCLLSVWRPNILPLDHQVLINSMIRFHLKWWMDTNCFVQRTFIHPPDPNAFFFTDASHFGWGAHLEQMRLSFYGPWLEDQSQLHINILEWWPFV